MRCVFVGVVCRGCSRLSALFRMLLQGADAVRSRASELVQLVSHLQNFSQLPEPGVAGPPGEFLTWLVGVSWLHLT